MHRKLKQLLSMKHKVTTLKDYAKAVQLILFALLITRPCSLKKKKKIKKQSVNGKITGLWKTKYFLQLLNINR